MMIAKRIRPALLGLAAVIAARAGIGAATAQLARQAPPQHTPAITAAPAPPAGPALIQLVPGGGPVHAEADDQDGNRLAPGLFSWAVPAGAQIGVQPDATGWWLTTPLGAAPGNYAIAVQYDPNPALSPVASVVVAAPITRIRVVVSPP